MGNYTPKLKNSCKMSKCKEKKTVNILMSNTSISYFKRFQETSQLLMKYLDIFLKDGNLRNKFLITTCIHVRITIK